MQKVLVVVAHCDDEVLGCGGTIAKHAAAGDLIHCLFLTSPDTQLHDKPFTLRKECNRAAEILGIHKIITAGFKDQMLDTVPILELARAIEAEVKYFKPSIVYTHSSDINQDHRAVYAAALVACRPWCSSVKKIRLFMVPGNNYHKRFVSNDFEDIGSTLKYKLKALRAYKSELREWPHPRSLENIKRIAHENANYILGCQYAELFYTIGGKS